jgi:Flp pilus assembly protein TadG
MWTAVVVRGRSMCAQLSRLRRDRSGSVLVMFALTFVVLMLSVGAAIDIGRWLHARDQTLAAIDSAVLAGGRYLQTSDDEAGAVAAAQSFYNQNVASRLPVAEDSISFSVVDNGLAVTASGTASINTVFLQFANINKLPLVNTAAAEFAKAEFATGTSGGSEDGNNDAQKLEIALMLDVTGSMQGQKLEDLKAAAEDLIGIVLPDSQTQPNVKIALVPFSEDIRLPTNAARDAARGSGLPASKTLSGSGHNAQSKTYYLSDCVVERTGTQKYTDAMPDPGQYVMAHYADTTTGSGSNKKGKCTIPQGSEVMPLSRDKAALLAKIEALSASGGTAGHLGTVWAWYTLSPAWSSLWSTESQPQAYGTENLQKIAILMTDGEYNTEYDANGVKVGSTGAGPPANDKSTAQARALCDAMKLDGDITIYTIGFDLGGVSSESYQTLLRCASQSNYFYNANDGVQLKNAFRDIAIKLASPLYLSR